MRNKIAGKRFSGIGSRVLYTLLILVFLVASPGSVFAQDAVPPFTVTPLEPDETITVEKIQRILPQLPPTGEVSVVVKLADESLAAYRGGIPGLPATSPAVTGQKKVNLKSNASRAYMNYLERQQRGFKNAAARSIGNARFTRDFNVIINGVGMIVPADRVAELFALPGVEDVYIDQLLQPDTDNSPEFIGATTVWSNLGGVESAGEGVIVGIIDSGIWPEHPSFSDPDPSGKPFAAAPGTYACQFSGGSNPGAPFTCNNKLIGAYFFLQTYQALVGLSPMEYTSARDDDGHGTHTASTAAGNSGVMAEILGSQKGYVSGIAPRAQVIAYRVCAAAGCYGTDSAAAIQQSIIDGVDVLNFSISGGANPYSDVVELAFLDAYNAGIFVAASAGNTGPGPDTVNHRGPWVTTVAASTQNRAFEATAFVTADNGDSVSVRGASIMGGTGPAELVLPETDLLCTAPFAPGSVEGKIVLCERGINARVNKGYNVMVGGAAGMILFNQSEAVTDLSTDTHYLPAVQIQYSDGVALKSFLAAHTGVMATLSDGVKTAAQGDVMASFSSRGGVGQTLGISKPDITAPGVQVLAGNTPYIADDSAPQGQLFQAIAGTSMSGPHIAGSGALLAALHPDWTPGQIKSALMTTAWTTVVKEDGVTPAGMFDTGSGRVDLTKAGDPGLTFNVVGADYMTHANDLWNVNYPSVYVPGLPGTQTLQRTARSVLDYDSVWQVSVRNPSASDFKITIPDMLYVPAGGEVPFSIAIDASAVPFDGLRTATLLLTEESGSGDRKVRIPVTFIRKQPALTLDTSCAPAVIANKTGVTNCSITVQNTSLSPASVSVVDVLPKELKLNQASVVGASASGNTVSFSGTVAGQQPASFSVTPGGVGYGYLPLSGFGIAPIVGMGDETIVNYNVPAFRYGGETYTRIGVVSNGYVVVGGGTGADVDYINQFLPNPTRPNNVIAPFWTDLNPAAGGAVRIGLLGAGGNNWIIISWEGVREWSTPKAYNFQIWLRRSDSANSFEETTLAYGPMGGNGDAGYATVGAENAFGTGGASYYFDGVGTLPYPGLSLAVNPIPGAPGETKTITFSATGAKVGEWTNVVTMTSNLYQGTSVKTFTGRVTAK
jgi:hypothetical protein